MLSVQKLSSSLRKRFIKSNGRTNQPTNGQGAYRSRISISIYAMHNITTATILQQKKYIYFYKVFLCDIKVCCCNYQLFCQAQSVAPLLPCSPVCLRLKVCHCNSFYVQHASLKFVSRREPSGDCEAEGCDSSLVPRLGCDLPAGRLQNNSHSLNIRS